MSPPFDLDRWMPLIAGAMLAMFVATVIIAINVLGKRLERHAEWMRLLDLRLQKLHKVQQRNHAQALRTIRPPPLSEARTVEIDVEQLRTLQRKRGSDK